MIRILCRSLCGIALTLALGVQAGDLVQPRVGQPGKDVIWVPTPERVVDQMLAFAAVGPDDLVVDLGSGDGRIVIAAAKRYGARALGVELNPDLVRLSELRAAREGVSDRAKFLVRDIFQTDLRQATVITAYLLPELNLKLRSTLLALAPGTRIVTHAFDMGEWQADHFDAAAGASLRLWVVPAPVEGHWAWKLLTSRGVRSFELDLAQQFQRIQGVVRVGELRLRLRAPSLRGDAIAFSLLEERGATNGVKYDFRGQVRGDRIEGEVSASNQRRPQKWVATRVPQTEKVL
jgi:SAM-dependent methyltransferase